ncbi:hypothetical protein GBAR_LOCUS19176 [Geodia barretti]|uniref:Uncharacterized protein n=1 Tax=Geodia barretti TaxID=519541 RepID=A0AA35WU97_GEOBA|nr:hypothetical protein GBAR_LOCUS19176 [Geodia barretti]
MFLRFDLHNRLDEAQFSGGDMQ